MNKIEELDKRIAELKKEKEIAELELEIKKIKKTVIEETIIKRVFKEEPANPYYPNIVWCGDNTNITKPFTDGTCFYAHS